MDYNDHLNMNDNFTRSISNDHTIQKIEEDYKNLNYNDNILDLVSNNLSEEEKIFFQNE